MVGLEPTTTRSEVGTPVGNRTLIHGLEDRYVFHHTAGAYLGASYSAHIVYLLTGFIEITYCLPLGISTTTLFTTGL